jgi:hypothetical protein
MSALSHNLLTQSLERLALQDSTPTAAVRHKTARRPDDRRRFAEAGDAVVQVLREAGCDLRFVEVHQRVEELLGGSVSRSSVKNYLAQGCLRRKPLFERVSRGRYRLR